MLIELAVRTSAKTELVDITKQVQDTVSHSLVSDGICFVFVPHTTAGIILNENWDPAVGQDILFALDQIVPRVGEYRHAEGNSPAHIKSTLTGASVTVPIERSEIVLGTWQGIYLAEFDGPRRRRVLIKVISG